MNLNVKLLEVSEPVEVRTGKNPYQTISVSYKQDDGQVKGKKMMSFNNPDAFKEIQKYKAGDSVSLVLEKDKNGYWNITEVKAPEAESVTSAATSSYSGVTTKPTGRVTGSNYETPEERKLRQKYIIRQSSLTTAIALFELQKAKPSVEDVLELAKTFEQFVYEDDAVQGIVEMDNDIPV